MLFRSITYRWYADRDVGACNLWDMADLRNHRHHGAFGALITEPRGSVYLNQASRKIVKTGSQVIIAHPLTGEFREFVLLMHDGVRLVDANGNLIIDPEPIIVPREDALEDFEDQGSRGFNYRAERFSHRLRHNSDLAKVFSSEIHGDPATPVFLPYAGDPVTMRLVYPADRARTHTFTLHGHTWLRNFEDVNSTYIPTKGQNTVGSHGNFKLFHGAGSLLQIPGDYLYRSGNIRWDLELGLWGIMRVLPDSTVHLNPLK